MKPLRSYQFTCVFDRTPYTQLIQRERGIRELSLRYDRVRRDNRELRSELAFLRYNRVNRENVELRSELAVLQARLESMRRGAP